jgi:hypothetical protein
LNNYYRNIARLDSLTDDKLNNTNDDIYDVNTMYNYNNVIGDCIPSHIGSDTPHYVNNDIGYRIPSDHIGSDTPQYVNNDIGYSIPSDHIGSDTPHYENNVINSHMTINYIESNENGLYSTNNINDIQSYTLNNDICKSIF